MTKYLIAFLSLTMIPSAFASMKKDVKNNWRIHSNVVIHNQNKKIHPTEICVGATFSFVSESNFDHSGTNHGSQYYESCSKVLSNSEVISATVASNGYELSTQWIDDTHFIISNVKITLKSKEGIFSQVIEKEHQTFNNLDANYNLVFDSNYELKKRIQTNEITSYDASKVETDSMLKVVNLSATTTRIKKSLSAEQLN